MSVLAMLPSMLLHWRFSCMPITWTTLASAGSCLCRDAAKRLIRHGLRRMIPWMLPRLGVECGGPLGVCLAVIQQPHGGEPGGQQEKTTKNLI